MRVSDQQLAQAVSELLSEGGESKKTMGKNFFQYLAKNHWLDRGEKILEAVEQYIDKKENNLPVTVTTARELTPHEKKEVEKAGAKLFPDSHHLFSFKTKPALIGGIRIETENTLYDATLRRSLQKLSQTLFLHV